MFTRSLPAPARQALQRACELADRFQDADYQLRALAGLASSCHRVEEFEDALAVGRRAESVATRSGDPLHVSIASWILGTSLLFLGEYAEALTYALNTRRLTSSPAARRAHQARLGRDGLIAAGCTMALIHWCQGLVDQARQDVRDVLVEARCVAHPLSRCTALIWCGGVIPLWLGDLDAAEQSIAELKDHAQRYNLSAFHAYGTGLEGQLAAQRDDFPTAERLLRSCVEYLRQRQSDNYPGFVDTLALVLARSGRCEEGLAAAEEVLRRIERTEQLWLMPEALRIKGEILLVGKANSEATAADCFVRSGELASRQGALAWELRAATSLARLLRDQGRSGDASETLQPVYRRFTEGFDTADLKSAKTLLDAIG